MWLNWMTCAVDCLEHAITDEQAVTAYRQGTGVYPAMCGHIVHTQALISPPGRRCRTCMTMYEQVDQPQRHGWIHRALQRLGWSRSGGPC